MSVQSTAIPVYKQVGVTPLECVKRYKNHFHLGSETVVSYAGRLDPMAEGVLLLLVGEVNKKRRTYEHLDKEYEVDIVVGYQTDTGDLMGKVVQTGKHQARIHKEHIEDASKMFVGSIEQRYPVYSSIKIRGKPMFWWARQNRLSEILIPSHPVTIESIRVLSCREVKNSDLETYIETSISHVQGDFRQEDIVRQWKSVLSTKKDERSQIFTIRVVCGSGTYMRTLVEDIGKTIGIPCCAFRIKRTRVGNFKEDECLSLSAR